MGTFVGVMKSVLCVLSLTCLLPGSYSVYTAFGSAGQAGVHGAYGAGQAGIYGGFQRQGGYGNNYKLGSQSCKTENTMIDQKECRIEWEEKCSSEERKVGEKVVYETQCENREVNDCKWVQMVYQQFPSLGIAGGPGKQYQECEMVSKEFCKEVPKNEDVIGDVETCVSTPKEVCQDKKKHAQKQICSRIKPETMEPKATK